MRVIDCDAHVEECVETWQYLDPEFYLLTRLRGFASRKEVLVGASPWNSTGWVVEKQRIVL